MAALLTRSHLHVCVKKTTHLSVSSSTHESPRDGGVVSQESRSLVIKGGEGKRVGEEHEKTAKVRELLSCGRLQSFLTPSSVPADSMSHPTPQQGPKLLRFFRFTQPYRAPAAAAPVPRLRRVYFIGHAPREAGLASDTVIVTVSEEVCLQERRQHFWR